MKEIRFAERSKQLCQSASYSLLISEAKPYSQWDTFLLRGSVGKLRRAVYIQNDIHHALIMRLIRLPDSCGILANKHNFESSLTVTFVAVIIAQSLDNHNLRILRYNHSTVW